MKRGPVPARNLEVRANRYDYAACDCTFVTIHSSLSVDTHPTAPPLRNRKSPGRSRPRNLLRTMGVKTLQCGRPHFRGSLPLACRPPLRWGSTRPPAVRWPSPACGPPTSTHFLVTSFGDHTVQSFERVTSCCSTCRHILLIGLSRLSPGPPTPFHRRRLTPQNLEYWIIRAPKLISKPLQNDWVSKAVQVAPNISYRDMI